MPTSRALSSTFFRLTLWSAVPSPHTSRSSTMMAQGYPANSSSIARWETSEAEVIPNGRRRKRNLPNGVLKVVRSEDSWSCFICHKPLLASRVENTVAWVTSSTVLIGWWARIGLYLDHSDRCRWEYRHLSSSQPPLNCETHSVGSDTSVIAPILTILSSSIF